jgi:hypothetical protein
VTQFVKEKFTFDGMYLKYDGQFIARYKHRHPVTKAKMIKVLIKHYVVEEFLARAKTTAPMDILRQDGILVFHYGVNGDHNYFTLEGKVL